MSSIEEPIGEIEFSKKEAAVHLRLVSWIVAVIIFLVRRSQPFNLLSMQEH